MTCISKNAHNKNTLYRVLGLMSGTSMDGIDAALLDTNGEELVQAKAHAFYPYNKQDKHYLQKALEAGHLWHTHEKPPPAVAKAHHHLTQKHIEAVQQFLRHHNLKAHHCDAIGFHGHTITHRPREGRCEQIGDGHHLASKTGIPVVGNFRQNDMQHGGQGAPLVPVYHRAIATQLTPRPMAFVNIGGITNITWLGDKGEMLAFDTGPGNALLDQWMVQHHGKFMDKDGLLSRQGTVDEVWLKAFMNHPYFQKAPPKSLDRLTFPFHLCHNLKKSSAPITLAQIPALGLKRACAHVPLSPRLWIICGGGRHNPAIMRAIKNTLSGTVMTAEEKGLKGDTIEAQAFAYLAVRSLRGLPLTYPSTTGVHAPVGGGVVYKAPPKPQTSRPKAG